MFRTWTVCLASHEPFTPVFQCITHPRHHSSKSLSLLLLRLLVQHTFACYSLQSVYVRFPDIISTTGILENLIILSPSLLTQRHFPNLSCSIFMAGRATRSSGRSGQLRPEVCIHTKVYFREVLHRKVWVARCSQVHIVQQRLHWHLRTRLSSRLLSHSQPTICTQTCTTERLTGALTATL